MKKKDNLWTFISLFFILELVNNEERGLQDFFQFLWLKEILPGVSLSH